MKYILNGSDISTMHSGQIAHSEDAMHWTFITKTSIKELTGEGATLRMSFNDNSYIDINLMDIQNQSTWNIDSGLTNALEDISGWLNVQTTSQEEIILDALKTYLFGSKGFTTITANNGYVTGSWYLIRTMDDTVFQALNENYNSLVGSPALAPGFVVPEKEMLTTSNWLGDGFTGIQLMSGKVIAYKK